MERALRSNVDYDIAFAQTSDVKRTFVVEYKRISFRYEFRKNHGNKCDAE